MSFGKARHTDSKPAAVGTGVPFDEPDQSFSVLEGVLGPVVIRQVAGRVAAERQDVLDAGLLIAVQDRLELVEGVPNAEFGRSGRASALGSSHPLRR
jgi:hypothetical protein